MKERPIIFSGPMVRAILSGRKTMTRRVVTNATSLGNFKADELLLDSPRAFVDKGPSPAGNPGQYLHAPLDWPTVCERRGWHMSDADDAVIERLYPLWMPGDRLWVREAWKPFSWHEGQPPFIQFEDGTLFEVVGDGSLASEEWEERLLESVDAECEKLGLRIDDQGSYSWDGPNPLRWRPSIFLARLASRLTLEAI